jgi:hypothetical protein
MSIEKFIPDQKPQKGISGLLNKALALVRKEMPPVYRVIYNADRTKKFVFNETRGENGFRQLSVSLYFGMGHEWSEAMVVMTRWSDSKEQLYGLEMSAITEDHPMPWEDFYYDRNTGGLKRKTGMMAKSNERTPDDERKMAKDKGFWCASDLPEFLDFEKTARQFLLQAKSLDFSFPALFPKELLK